MKSFLIFAILIAACGYGAFTHFAAEDLKISQLEKRREAAAAETAVVDQQIAKIRPESDELKRTLAETLATAPVNELAKSRAALTAKRETLTKELEAAKIAAEAATKSPEDLVKELADLTAQVDALNATIVKLDKENLQLMKYQAIEEAALPATKRTGSTRK
jgi:chromosome segregation ATPase